MRGEAKQGIQGLRRCYALGNLFKLLTPHDEHARISVCQSLRTALLLSLFSVLLHLFHSRYLRSVFWFDFRGLVKRTCHLLPTFSVYHQSYASVFNIYHRLLFAISCLRKRFYKLLWTWFSSKEKEKKERGGEREEKEEDEGKRIKKRRPLVPIFTPADSRMLAGTSSTWLTTSRVSTFYHSIFIFKSILSKIDRDL